MRAYWKVVYAAQPPDKGDENRRPLPAEAQRILDARGRRRGDTGERVCTRLARTFFDGLAVCQRIPGSRLICCLGDARTTVAEAGGPDAG